MNDIIGRWSTSWFFSDPADEVLVFLPEGRGVFEYYWWQLDHYKTFTYQIEEDNLLIIGDRTYSYDSEQNVIKEESTILHFSGKFQVREANLEESKSGCEVILELSTPIEGFFQQQANLDGKSFITMFLITKHPRLGINMTTL